MTRGTVRADLHAGTSVTLQQQARALGDPTRHRIFRYIADARRPVTVAELTDFVGFNHNAVRQHLAKLVEADLVVGRTLQSGARGRPRLVYEVAAGAEGQWGISGPYERLSGMLADIIRTGETPVEVGRRFGGAMATPSDTPEGTVADIVVVMERQGFRPALRPAKRRPEVVLEQCPFREVAVEHADTVCSLHLGIAQGLAESGADVAIEELVVKDPRRAGCRLRLRVGVSAQP
jgi:predicted ArsR family transcriptional regulator